jgi:Right handed beta helix region
VAATALALGAGSAAASGNTYTADCVSNPANAFNEVFADNPVAPGDTIIVSGFCQGSFSIPDSYYDLTIEGSSSVPSGFEPGGDSETDTLVSWTIDSPSADGTTSTIENLTFRNAVTPAASSDPSALDIEVDDGGLALSGDTFTGNQDDGTADVGIFAYDDDVTLSGDTFSDNTATDFANVLHVVVESDTLTLDGDTVDGNQAVDSAPVLVEQDVSDACRTENYAVTVENSTFSGNTLDLDDDAPATPGGAGLDIEMHCVGDSPTLTGNTFDGNVIDTDGNEGAYGAGLLLNDDYDGDDGLVTQSGNVFENNAITAPADTGNSFYGAGEAVAGPDLDSADDTFTANSLPGNYDDGGESGGAGLATGSQGECAYETATLEQDAIANNQIAMNTDAGDSAWGADGAGLYYYDDAAYCHEDGVRNAPANDGDLNLDDSTVIDNAALDDGSPLTGEDANEATAGIEDDSECDALELDNTIVWGNVGGTETSGFDEDCSAGAPLSASRSATSNAEASDFDIDASYSDFCIAPDSSGEAWPSPGSPPNTNICADPLLVTDTFQSLPTGEASGGPVIRDAIAAGSSAAPTINVGETSSSPTIDAGSNGLIADGLVNDIYGNSRALAKACPLSAGTVDIGAAEYVPSCSSPSPISTPTPTPLPSKKKLPCASRRNIVMHLQYTFFLSSPALISRARVILTSLTVHGFGKRELRLFGPNKSEVRLDLRKLPFGTYRVHAYATLTNGEKKYQQREWHTCRPFHWKYPPGKPRNGKRHHHG